MIRFVTNKIKRYGFLGALKQGYVRYSNEILWSTGLHTFVVMKIDGVRYKYFKSNVSYFTYEIPNLHHGDVNEIKRFSKEGSVVVDIGANIGTVCMPVAKHVGVKGKVYAIEAHPKTFSYLQENIKLNKLENISAFNIAIGEKNGLVEFSDSDLDDINVVSKKIEKENGEINYSQEKKVLVPMMRLDDLLSDLDKIDVLKIDVEGYEKFILENATETLKKTKVVYAEYYEDNTKNFGYHREEIKNILENSGFTCELSDLSKHVISVDNIIGIKK